MWGGSSVRRLGSADSRQDGSTVTTSSCHPRSAAYADNFCHRKEPILWSGGNAIVMSSKRRVPVAGVSDAPTYGCGRADLSRDPMRPDGAPSPAPEHTAGEQA